MARHRYPGRPRSSAIILPAELSLPTADLYGPSGDLVTGSTFMFTPNQAYVDLVYHDLLRREVDPKGLAYWSGQLDSGAITRAQFSLMITNSAEYFTDVIETLYEHYLHRQADAGGLGTLNPTNPRASTGWLGAMIRGSTDEQIAASLAGSSEYYQNEGEARRRAS